MGSRTFLLIVPGDQDKKDHLEKRLMRGYFNFSRAQGSIDLSQRLSHKESKKVSKLFGVLLDYKGILNPKKISVYYFNGLYLVPW